MGTQASIALGLIFSSIIFTSFGCSSNYGSKTGNLAANSGANALYQSDPNNCGSQGNVCGGTQPGCCNGSCIDLTVGTYNSGTLTTNNCGACGNVCTLNANGNGSSLCQATSNGAGVCVSSDFSWAGSPPYDLVQCSGITWYCGCLCMDGSTAFGGCVNEPGNCSGDCNSACSGHSGSINSCNRYYSGVFISAGDPGAIPGDYFTDCMVLSASLDGGATIGINSGANWPCPNGYTSCSGECLFLSSDPNNCGACGNVCSNGQQCWAGGCQAVGSNSTLQSTAIPPSQQGAGIPSLVPGSAITSQNGVYELILQIDGNLVLYKTTIPNSFINCPSSSCQAIFSSNTSNIGAYGSAYLQTDGNFVVYNINSPAFATNTNGNPGDTLILQNDGNLVIYSNVRMPLWSSNTAGSSCPLGQTQCSSTCVNTSTDINNCGGCGKVCSGNSDTCSNGQCICNAAGSICGGCTPQCGSLGCVLGNNSQAACTSGKTCYQGSAPNQGIGQCQ